MARYWVENRRCANSIVEGSYFCVMHADCRPPKSEDSGVLNDTKDHLKEGNEKDMMEKHLRCTGVTVQDSQPKEMMKDDLNYLTKHAEQNPDQVGGNTLAATVNDDGAVVKIEQLDFQVSGRPSEKHLKGAASNANGGVKTSGPLRDPIRDKNLSSLVAGMSVKERKTFLKAHDLLCKYMNQGLSLSKGLCFLNKNLVSHCWSLHRDIFYLDRSIENTSSAGFLIFNFFLEMFFECISGCQDRKMAW